VDSKIQLKHFNNLRKLHKRELGLTLGPADQSKPKFSDILSKITQQQSPPSQDQMISEKSPSNPNRLIEEPLPTPTEEANCQSSTNNPKGSNEDSQSSFITAKSKFHDANLSKDNSILLGSDPGNELVRKKSTVTKTYVKKMELKDCELAKMKAENCDLFRKNEELRLAILKMQHELESKDKARGLKLLDLDQQLCAKVLENTELENRLYATNDFNQQLELKFTDGEKVRAELNRKILEFKGNLRVFCRVRALIPSKAFMKIEMGSGSQSNSMEIADPASTSEIIHFGSTDNREIRLTNTKDPAKKPESYFFDRVFKPEESQIDVFAEILPFIQNAFDGGKLCMFAYGITGSGKTYTMEGNLSDFKTFSYSNSKSKIMKGSKSVHKLTSHNEGSYMDCLPPETGILIRVLNVLIREMERVNSTSSTNKATLGNKPIFLT
jgi:hypothetical protein